MAGTGRLAPSPTGLLHLGHARSFLLAWWQARSQGGRVVLRLEDLDAGRVKPGMTEQALRDLEWLGLDWDGEVVVQSDRKRHHAEALQALVHRGLAYACTCTRNETLAAQSAPHAGEERGRYPGTCRGRYASLEDAERESGRPAALRLFVEPGEVRFEDGFAGAQAFDVAREAGDFPVARRAGEAAYQLAVVVDDARDGVTEVLRGDDLLPSTARQILVQRALGIPHPRWFHVPLVVDEGGTRLAKRSDSLSLRVLRERGVDPRRIVAWIAARSGMDAGEACTAREALASFGLARVPREAVVVPGDVFGS